MSAEHAGHYRLTVDLTANEKYVDGVFDYNKCRLVFKVDGRELLQKEYTREGGKPFHYTSIVSRATRSQTTRRLETL